MRVSSGSKPGWSSRTAHLPSLPPLPCFPPSSLPPSASCFSECYSFSLPPMPFVRPPLSVTLQEGGRASSSAPPAPAPPVFKEDTPAAAHEGRQKRPVEGRSRPPSEGNTSCAASESSFLLIVFALSLPLSLLAAFSTDWLLRGTKNEYCKYLALRLLRKLNSLEETFLSHEGLKGAHSIVSEQRGQLKIAISRECKMQLTRSRRTRRAGPGRDSRRP